MKPLFNISYRHGSHRVYACDINRYVWNPRGYYEYVRVASLPMNVDDRTEHPMPSYAVKLLAWYERRALLQESE